MKLDIKQIILRKRDFILNNTVFDKEDYKDYNAGEIKAISEILIDIDSFEESELILKYSNIIKEIQVKNEKNILSEPKKIEELDGYNNMIVFVLALINPMLEYELDD